MKDVHVHMDIGAPVDEVAAIVSSFEGLARWNPAASDISFDGRGVGAFRSYRFANADLMERLEAVSEDGRDMRYTVLHGPLPASWIEVRCWVQPTAERSSRVHCDIRFDAREENGLLVEHALVGAHRAFLTLLKARLEQFGSTYPPGDRS
jgi:hypothetical protein